MEGEKATIALNSKQLTAVKKLLKVHRAGRESYYRFLYYDGAGQRLISYDGKTVMAWKTDLLKEHGNSYVWYANEKLFVFEVDKEPPFFDTLEADYWKASNNTYCMVLNTAYSKEVPLLMNTIGVPFDLRDMELLKGESWTVWAPHFGDVYMFESENWTVYLTDLRALI